MSEYPKTITLPRSGRTAVIQREPTWKDMRMAERISGQNADPMQRMGAIICQVLLVDNRSVLMEDLDAFVLIDVTAIFQALGLNASNEEGEGKKNSLTLEPSLSLSNGGSQRPN